LIVFILKLLINNLNLDKIKMTLLLNGDCLEQLKQVQDDSVDLIFCDLPYGQTSCKWDIIIPWEPLWKELMRVKKLHTPLFFTTTTKFGVEIIKSAPKKCPFRYDIVWAKSAPCGFLSAKKMPMRKHEMIYVFYEKLPFYDLSSHQHKFIKTKPTKSTNVSVVKEDCYVKNKTNDDLREGFRDSKYDPPLPTSVVKEKPLKVRDGIEVGKDSYPLSKEYRSRKSGGGYDPPLPTSVVNEPEPESKMVVPDSDLYGKVAREQSKEMGGCQVRYDPPLPTSVVKEGQMTKDFTPNKNGNLYNCPDNQEFSGRNGAPRYEPPLPTSVVNEESKTINTLYQDEVEVPDYVNKRNKETGMSAYEPPLPTSMLEVKSTRGKHSTEKPVALMEWILKYYSKEGDVVLDPTMGSGSTGVSCKNMKRNFIGIEKDEEIFQVACERLE